MNTKNTIKYAVEYLEATQISPRRWAYYATEVRRWYKLTRSDLEALQAMLTDDGPGYAYSAWCSDGYGTEMPERWHPHREPVARIDVVRIPRFGCFGRARTYNGSTTIDCTDTYPLGCDEQALAMAEALAKAKGYRVKRVAT